MKLLRTLSRHILGNIAEYYTLFVIVVALPVVVSMMAGVEWGMLLSFLSQAAIGVFYIRGRK